MKKLIAVLAAGALMMGAAALVFWLQLLTERERGAELASNIAAQQASGIAVGAMPALQPSAATATVNVLPPASVTAAASETSLSSSVQADAGEAAPFQKPVPATALAADPMSGILKAMMLQQYPDVAAELDLTPAQAEQFLDLFARQQTETGTLSMGLMGGSAVDAGRREQLQRQMLDKERADQAELRKMLGSKYPRWEQYQGTAQARQRVNDLRTALAAIDKPLAEPQSKALIIAFATDASRAQEEDRAWVESGAARSSPNMMRERMQRQIEGQRRLVDLASPHLDAAQLEHFRRKNEQDLAMVSSMLGMMGAEK